MPVNAKVLVVDDDALTRQCLANYFLAEGYLALEAETAEAAEALLLQQPFDLVLLDIRLPGKDGLTLTRELRVKSPVGIILVTGRQDEVDRLIGLECGADEYVTKPFNPRELLARAKNLINRVRLCQEAHSQTALQQLKRFDKWTLNVNRRLLLDESNRSTPLTDGEFQLLQAFIDHAGHTLSRNQLLDEIRNREWTPNDRTIDVLVGRLRRKLRDDPADPRLILTIHGSGYLFAPKAVDVA